jgi:hypothetical protein
MSASGGPQQRGSGLATTRAGNVIVLFCGLSAFRSQLSCATISLDCLPIEANCSKSF